jgi:type VI secretion system protein ImpK
MIASDIDFFEELTEAGPAHPLFRPSGHPTAEPNPEREPVLTTRQVLARISPQPDRLVAVRTARVPLLEAARPLLDLLAGMPGKSDVPSREPLHHVLLREVVSFQSVCQDARLDEMHAVAASYMLCTALDEAANNSPGGKTNNASPDTWVGDLAPHFHKDSNGGVGVFRMLGFLVKKPPEHMDLLELTLLVLALGFEGPYLSARNGRRVLNDIRMRVFSLVYHGRGGAPSPRWTAIERLLKGDDFDSVFARTTKDIFS